MKLVRGCCKTFAVAMFGAWVAFPFGCASDGNGDDSLLADFARSAEVFG